jgi:hypothetical protein
MAIDLAALDRAIIEAHAAGDTARMAALYHDAACTMAALHRDDAEAFYLTHAYVLSLDCGDRPRAADCHRRLVAMGREA